MQPFPVLSQFLGGVFALRDVLKTVAQETKVKQDGKKNYAWQLCFAFLNSPLKNKSDDSFLINKKLIRQETET